MDGINEVDNKVLIIHGNSGEYLSINNAAKNLDVNIFLAKSVSIALSLMTHHCFALIILDVTGADIDTVLSIRKYNNNSDTHIINIAASIDEDLLTRGHDLGIIDYLIKPVNLQLLLFKISVFFELDKCEQKSYKQKLARQDVNEELLGYNYNLESKVEEQINEIVLAKEMAEKANRSKSEFLANMSHEFRTPLHGVLSIASIGKAKIEKSSREKLYEYFCVIEESGQRLKGLIDNLLDLSKMDSGKCEFDFGLNSLNSIIAESINGFTNELEKLDVSINFQRLQQNDCIECDRLRFGQVIDNICKNAIKVSNKGDEIDVTMANEKISDGTDWLSITIADQGVGIEIDELDRIFEKFTLNSKHDTGKVGSGLGLAICSEIVRSHGGSIRAANRNDGGAVFTIKLPYKRQYM